MERTYPVGVVLVAADGAVLFPMLPLAEDAELGEVEDWGGGWVGGWVRWVEKKVGMRYCNRGLGWVGGWFPLPRW